MVLRARRTFIIQQLVKVLGESAHLGTCSIDARVRPNRPMVEKRPVSIWYSHRGSCAPSSVTCPALDLASMMMQVRRLLSLRLYSPQHLPNV